MSSKEKPNAPSKPSPFFHETLEYALRKLEEVESDDRYIVDFKHFHRPSEDGYTHVDFPGCILTDFASSSQDVPYTFAGDAWYDTLVALDNLAHGDVHRAVSRLRIYPTLQQHRIIPKEVIKRLERKFVGYEVNRDFFKSWIRGVIREFKRINY